MIYKNKALVKLIASGYKPSAEGRAFEQLLAQYRQQMWEQTLGPRLNLIKVTDTLLFDR